MPGDQGRGETSRWEWIAAAIGALLVVGAIGYTVYQAVTKPAGAVPEITVRVDSVAAYAGGYVVSLTVGNTGAATAASVVVEGTLRSDTGTIETSSATLDYVPARAHRAAGLVFTHDPSRHRLEVRPLGYDRP